MSGKKIAKRSAGDVDTATKKKRTLEESKAAARKYQESLRKAGKRPSSPEEGSSNKKPRVQAAARGFESTRVKKETQRESRKRAKEYAQTLAQPRRQGDTSNGGASAGRNGAGVDGETTESEQDSGESDEDMPNAAEPDRPTAGHRTVLPTLPQIPPMPDLNLEVRPAQPLQPPPSNIPGGPSGGSIHSAVGAPGGTRSRPSFLRHAKPQAPCHLQTPSQGNRLPEGGKSTGEQMRSRGTRESFLNYALQSGKRTESATPTPLPPSPQPTRTPTVLVEAEDSNSTLDTPGIGVNTPANTTADKQRKVKNWAFTGMVALTPLIVFGVVGGVLLHLLPQLKSVVVGMPRVVASLPASVVSAARNTWGRVPSFGPKAHSIEKCFLASGDDPSICKVGAEVTDCPNAAVCGVGKILSCGIPFEYDRIGERCVLNAAARDEVDIVVRALRQSTVMDQCGLLALTLPTGFRSTITLREAAKEADRQQLSLLASLPPGRVSGLIDLEGPAALAFGGGYGGFEGVGSGSERIARLSAAAHKEVELPGWCSLGHMLRRNWKIELVGMIIMLVFLGFVLNIHHTEQSYKERKEVCSIRNESYKALLIHAANAGGPMQVSHIQDFVTDKRRDNGGDRVSSKKKVQELWSLVEREVDLDSRIRRVYLTMRGQRSVPCWEWLSPITNYKVIGDLDPGPPPNGRATSVPRSDRRAASGALPDRRTASEAASIQRNASGAQPNRRTTTRS